MLKKTLYSLLVLLLVVCMVSGIVFMAPVDPAQLTFGQRSDTATVEAKKAELGLEKPLYVQLLGYMADLSPVSIMDSRWSPPPGYRYLPVAPLRGDRLLVVKWPWLRESYQTGRPVAEMLSRAVSATLVLAAVSFSLSLVLGILLGSLAALSANRFWDNAITALSVFGYAAPSYVVAMFLSLWLAFAWGAWTGLPLQGPLMVLDDFGEWRMAWRNLVLPALALGLRPVALFTQLVRSALLDALEQPYVRTAVAKGLPAWQIYSKHLLPNIGTPLVSAASGWLGGLLGGAFFVESVFAFKGLGDVTVNALKAFDLPVVLGCVLFTCLVFVALNLMTDFLYRVVDPRVTR